MKALQHITKCILCVPESPFQISAHGFDPINIMMPDERIGKFILALQSHIQDSAKHEERYIRKHLDNGASDAAKQALIIQHTKHAALLSSITVSTRLAHAFSALSGFDTEDSELQTAKEGARQILHAMTARRIPDDKIRFGISQIGLAGGDAENAFKLIRELLDASNGIKVEEQKLVTL